MERFRFSAEHNDYANDSICAYVYYNLGAFVLKVHVRSKFKSLKVNRRIAWWVKTNLIKLFVWMHQASLNGAPPDTWQCFIWTFKDLYIVIKEAYSGLFIGVGILIFVLEISALTLSRLNAHISPLFSWLASTKFQLVFLITQYLQAGISIILLGEPLLRVRVFEADSVLLQTKANTCRVQGVPAT